MVLLEVVVADYFFNDPDDNKVTLAKLYTYLQISKDAKLQSTKWNDLNIKEIKCTKLCIADDENQDQLRPKPFER